MSEAKAFTTVQNKSAVPGSVSQPRDHSQGPASTSQVRGTKNIVKSPSGKFLIHTAEGKRHEVKSTSKTLRILPNDKGFNEIKTLDGGVWETVFTSPFGFDVTIVSEDF